MQLNITTIQLAINDQQKIDGRLRIVERSLSHAATLEDKPGLIILPELWGVGFYGFDNYAAAKEELTGRTFQMLAHWAVTLGCYIHGGSIIEDGGDSLYNTSLFISPQGTLVGSYRKIHLYGYQSREQELLARGNSTTLVDTPWGRVGLSTCYDLRFPELYRKLSAQGATIMLVCSAWPEVRLEHWRLFNQARAVENQSWLISCNCTGTMAGFTFAGHSMIVSPTGEILAEAGGQSSVTTSSIDTGWVNTYRADFPVLKDRVF
ncbi:MAG: carbon-nitrogen family hydrolase [Symbiobacteriaceae bacterium]|nr:carbon-nitrogen family hydrolase [Symbiobacteriaceae bacterium]